MADVNVILGALTAAVAAHTALETWAVSEYGRAVKVSENWDARKDPVQGDCPLAILYPLVKQGDLTDDPKLVVVGVSCVVFDSGVGDQFDFEWDDGLEWNEPLEWNPEDANVIRFAGGAHVETFRKYVLAAIKTVLPPGITIVSVTTDYNTIEQFPFVSVGMDITLAEFKTLGADALE